MTRHFHRGSSSPTSATVWGAATTVSVSLSLKARSTGHRREVRSISWRFSWTSKPGITKPGTASRSYFSVGIHSPQIQRTSRSSSRSCLYTEYDGGRVQGRDFHSYRTWNTLKCHHKPSTSKPVCSKGNCMRSYPKRKILYVNCGRARYLHNSLRVKEQIRREPSSIFYAE